MKSSLEREAGGNKQTNGLRAPLPPPLKPFTKYKVSGSAELGEPDFGKRL